MTPLSLIKDKILIQRVPAYGNKIFYSLGFLALTSLSILIVTGLAMVFEGSKWWLQGQWGIYFRSVHLWSAQAFVFLIILHALTVFLTSGFKAPRRLTWILGSTVFFLALAEAEFGYDLRGDFSSQYRALQGADFFNGAYLGKFINVLNQTQIYGLHIAILPIIILTFLFFHYFLVKTLGIAKPYRPEFEYKIVRADHKKLFLRGGGLALLVLGLAFIFPSPLILPTTIKEVADENPSLFNQTLLAEFTKTSDTANYFDSINPYQYDTREIYVTEPYGKYLSLSGGSNELSRFLSLSEDNQKKDLAEAEAYFESGVKPDPQNPLILVINSLGSMAQSGLYQAAIDEENPGINPTYSLRFLSDTGVLESEAASLHITTEQWGMMREETKSMPLGAWWLSPIGVLNHSILANDPSGDRDGAEILGSFALLFVLFPYLPWLNRIPEKLRIAELIWKTKSSD